MTIRAGFVELGSIGGPMAGRLVAGALETTVYDVAPGDLQPLAAAGEAQAPSPRDLAAGCDLVGLRVRDDDVRAVTLGDEGLLAGSHEGLVIAIHGTILPSTAEAMADAAAERGVVIDACISSGRSGAAQGSLACMVGGDPVHLERCRPAFETSAKRIVQAGPLGSGAATKLCNNPMTSQGFLAARESMLLAQGPSVSREELEA